MKINLGDFKVRAGRRIRLKRWATHTKPLYKSEKQYKELLRRDVEELSELQRLIFASSKNAVLLVFQAMDAAGKDGAISHVLTGVNPAGCEVFGFKEPSAEELGHDFLWRASKRLPSRGRIGIFNRSYYEEVLIARVHPKVLNDENIPDDLVDRKTIWRERFRSIMDFEKHLHRNGTRIIKFYLHLSKEEQRRRFLARIEEPEKNWKFSMADIRERGYWNRYMRAYEECLGATSTKAAPWHIVPADDKLNARLIVSRIVIDALRGLRLRYPKLTRERRSELLSIRKKLER